MRRMIPRFHRAVSGLRLIGKSCESPEDRLGVRTSRSRGEGGKVWNRRISLVAPRPS